MKNHGDDTECPTPEYGDDCECRECVSCTDYFPEEDRSTADDEVVCLGCYEWARNR